MSNIDPLAIAVVAAWLILFGGAAAWLAVRRRRQPGTWAVFGAILGPAAVAILLLAPPGTCWSCAAPTQGWLTQCAWCEEDVRESARDVPEAKVRVHGPLTVIDGTAPRAARTSEARRDDRNAPPLPARRGVDASPDERRIELPSRPPLAEQARRAAAAASATFEPVVDPVRRLKANLGRPAQPLTAVAALAAPARAPVAAPRSIVLASAIYVTGTRGLQAGSRYGIALFGDDLRILGPVDTDPSALAIVHSLRGIDATGIQGRLIITAGDGRRDRLALVFMAVAGGSPEGVADAIVAAAGGVGFGQR